MPMLHSCIDVCGEQLPVAGSALFLHGIITYPMLHKPASHHSSLSMQISRWRPWRTL